MCKVYKQLLFIFFMYNKKISGVIVVYNEESKIRKCLESIKNVVDEIVVIHDGPCHDKTLEILKEYKNLRIYMSKFNIGEAEPHRPNSVKFAQYDWILPIDADERLSPELSEFIMKLKKNNFKYKNKKVDMVKANWVRVNKDIKYNTNNYKFVLFNKKLACILGIPHFSWQTKGKSIYLKNCLLLHEQMDKMDIKSLFKKSNKWAKVHAKYYLQFYMDKSSVTNYNYNVNKFPKETMLRIKYPLITLFPMLFSAFWGNKYLYHKLDILYATRKIFNMILYQFLVSLYMFYYKIVKFEFKVIDDNTYYLYK